MIFFRIPASAGLPDSSALFGICDRGDGPVQKPPLVLEFRALQPERRGKLKRIAIEQGFDLLQRQADELEGHDLLQALEIAININPVAGVGALRFEQPKAVVMMQRLNRYARAFGEFMNTIQPANLRNNHIEA